MASLTNFDRKFRIKILALLLDNAWVTKYGLLVSPDYFERNDEVIFAQAVLEYRSKYGYSPKDVTDVIALSSKLSKELPDKYREFADSVYHVTDTELASDTLIEFAKLQSAKNAVIELSDELRLGKTDNILPTMTRVLNIGSVLLDEGIDPVLDSNKWLYQAWQDKVKTGLHHLDMVLDGGLGVPELGVILAPMNRGKSMALVNIGFGAASLGSGKNVVHFTHEMLSDKIAKRYAARMVFRFPAKDDNLSKYDEELQRKARQLLPGKIKIIGGARKMTQAEMEHHLDVLTDSGYEPGVILDDYADLIVPEKRYTEKRHELSAIYEWMRSVSEKYKCPVWTASQAVRSSFGKELITLEDMAEDIGKAAIADVIVSLCQTWEESQANQARLFVAKNRDGRAGDIVSCKFMGASQAIITTGYSQYKKKEKSKDV